MRRLGGVNSHDLGFLGVAGHPKGLSGPDISVNFFPPETYENLFIKLPLNHQADVKSSPSTGTYIL